MLSRSDPLDFVRSALASMSQQPLVLTLDDLRAYAEPPAARMVVPEALEELRRCAPAPLPRDDGDVTILKDITGNSTCEGNIIDFARYFNDRFKKIKKILSARRELVGCLPVSKATKFDREVRMVAIVNEVRTTKNGHKLLEVEDDEGRCPVLILRDSPLAQECVVTDEVIGIVGKTSSKGDMVVMNELIRPDVQVNRKAMAPTDSWASVAFMSDVHVGSNTFLQKPWERMIDWMKNEGPGRRPLPGRARGRGRRHRHLPRAGGGAGHRRHLRAVRVLADHLKEIPDGIRIIVQPGNHDAVRPAEPQPTFPRTSPSCSTPPSPSWGTPATSRSRGGRSSPTTAELSTTWIVQHPGAQLQQPHRGHEGDAEAPPPRSHLWREDAPGPREGGPPGDRGGA